MSRINAREIGRGRRHARLRKKIVGTPDRPRLSVFKSCRHVHAQIIDDTKGQTLAHVTSMHKDVKAKGCNVEAAKAVGKKVAQMASEKGVRSVVFDRGGYPYHGVVKALAESAREGGLEF